jgi:hypothetical protein
MTRKVKLTAQNPVSDALETETVTSLVDTFLHGAWRSWHVNVQAIETGDMLIALTPGMVMSPEVLVELRVCIDSKDALLLSGEEDEVVSSQLKDRTHWQKGVQDSGQDLHQAIWKPIVQFNRHVGILSVVQCILVGGNIEPALKDLR